jgi:hypothetical protein
MKLGQKFDARVARLSEGIARRISRRDALRAAIIGGVTSIATLSIGQRPALANYCDCGPTSRCNRYGHRCRAYRCPSGYETCKNRHDDYCSCSRGHYNRQGYCCEYANGKWVACNRLGKGHGYRMCYDCVGHGHNRAEDCADWCTCLTECICCHCRSAKEVRSELNRIQQLVGDD